MCTLVLLQCCIFKIVLVLNASSKLLVHLTLIYHVDYASYHVSYWKWNDIETILTL